MNEKLRTGALAVVRALVYCGLFAAFYFLFLQQAFGAYPSDLPAHIKPPADDTYSMLRVVYQALLKAFNVRGVAAFLALVEVATLGLTEYLVRKLAGGVKPWVAFVAALACNFAIAVYLPFIHSYFVVGSPGGNCWHNSTYSVMKLLALAATVFYLKFDGRIATRSKAAAWVLFAVFLTLTTSVKPSFAVVFGPAVFVLCLVDLKREGASSVKRSLLVGLALLVALAVVFWQMTVLFPSDGSSEGGIAFGLAKVWRARHANIFVSFFQSLAFPLLVVCATRRMVLRDRTLLLAWLVLVVAMAQYVFLYETGERTYHGNFGWGLCYALFYLFIISCVAFLQERGRCLHLLGAAAVRPMHPAYPTQPAHAAHAATMAGAATGAGDVTGTHAAPKEGAGAEGGAHAPDEGLAAGTGAHAADSGLAAGATSGMAGAHAAPSATSSAHKAGALDYLTLLAFALHVGSGVWYFIRVMLGNSYY